jgi:hypothetical protein
MSSNFTLKSKIGAFIVTLSIVTSSCAVLKPSDANGPRSNVTPYPILATDSSTREGATLAWHQLTQRYGLPQESPLDLEPLTATIRSVPTNLNGSILLPKVGGDPLQTEEEMRESLRRFIAEWQSLIGADPHQLSLVERTDNGPVKTARYEQRPFRYPLRGDVGSLTIRFQNDRRVLDISSSCIPAADRFQSALNSLNPVVTVEEAATLVKQQPISVAGDRARTLTWPANAVVSLEQLVVYAKPAPDRQTLELHLAWEIDVANGPIKTIYLDAITRQVLDLA